MSNVISIQTVAAAAYAFYTGDPRYIALTVLSGYSDYQRGNTKVEGPKLSDLSVGTSQYGQPIPWIYGTTRLAGQVWWSSEKRVLSQTSGGKGGPTPEVTTYSYEVDMIVGLCEVSPGQSIKALSRIWSNGKLVWTRLEGASAESLAASDGANLWRRMSFYDGSETQLPDPMYEAAVGVGSAPAFRGRAYVAFEGLQLGGSGYIPSLSFEVLAAGQYGIGATELGPEQTLPSGAGSIGTAAAGGNTVLRVPMPQWTASYATASVLVFDLDVLGSTITQVGSYTSFNRNANVAVGTSDTPVLVQGTGSTAWAHLGSTGTRVDFTLPASIGGSLRFALAGEHMVFGSGSASPGLLYRFSSGGGTVQVTSAATGRYPESLAIVGSTLYAADRLQKVVFAHDLETLDAIETIDRPSVVTSDSDAWPEVFDFGGELGLICKVPAGRKIYVRRGGAWIELGTLASSVARDSQSNPSAGVVGGLLVGGLVRTNPVLCYRTWFAKITATPAPQTVADVIDDICERSGMPAGTWDTSALSSLTRGVRSMGIAQVMSGRSAIEQLAAAFFFSATLSDKLYFRPRQTSPAATIPYADLGAGIDKAQENGLPLTYAGDLELSPQVAVTYVDFDADQQSGTQYSDRILSGQASMVQLQLAIGMTASEAKAVADGMVIDSAAALSAGSLSLPLQYAKVEPGDVLLPTGIDGTTRRVRVARKREEKGVITVDVVGDDAGALISAGITDETRTPSNTVTAYADTILYALDIPLLRDLDDSPGWYLIARGANEPWPGCTVYQSGDDVTYTAAIEVQESGVLGVATTTLGDFTGGGWDEVNSVTVDIGYGTVSSSTRAAMQADATINVWLVGSEILRARTATQVSAGVYTLTGLLRGLQGTEWAKATHGSSERVALLQPRGMRRIAESIETTGVAQWVKAVTLTKSATAVIGTSFTNTNAGLRPLAPDALRAQVNGSQDIVISWGRRSRLATIFLSSTGVPLGESTESYRVEIRSASDALIRTIYSTTTSAAYLRSDQVDDGIALGDDITIRVVQISQAVGDGYAASIAAKGAASAVPQVSAVTVAGVFEAGAGLRVKVGSSTFNYTTLVGDADLSGVATALAALIDASATYAASASDAVVNISGALGVPFSVVATVPAGDNTVTAAVTQSAATAQDETSYRAYVNVTNPITGQASPVPAGITFTVRVQRPIGTTISSFSYTTTASSDHSTIHQGLTTACAANATLSAAGYVYGQTTISGWGDAVGLLVGPAGVESVYLDAGATSPFNLLVSVQSPGQAAVPSDLPQKVSFNWSGTAMAGWRYRITLDGADFDYTAVGGDTMVDVAAGLAALVNADPDFIGAVDPPASSTVLVTGLDGASFEYDASVLPSTITLSAALVQSAAF